MTTIVPPDAEIALSLSEALVRSSNAPALLLDGDLKVVAASVSYLRTFQIDPAMISGRAIADLGDDQWDTPQLRSLLKATVAGQADISSYEMDIVRAGRVDRRLVLNAQKLQYGSDQDVRVLLTIDDVTDARAAEKLQIALMGDKDVLLRELQHRVANSLQIIASVLMLSARRVNSDETRRYLYDAHNRVMSVAALQQRLSVSTTEEVRLGSYFNDLCESIGASMIADRDQLALTVGSDDSVANADASVSLGLIVTELVINALKHAFPGGRRGVIKVDYRSDRGDWTLCVSDDGVGIATDPASAKPGLGTGIVTALAKQLGARVDIVAGHPGTAVKIVHVEVPAADRVTVEAA